MGEFNATLFRAIFEQPQDLEFVRRVIGRLTVAIQVEATTLVDSVIRPHEAGLTSSIKRAMALAHVAGLRPGPKGWENALFTQKNWGFDPRNISPAVPVFVWCAGRDTFTPSLHGKWLAEHIPGAIGKFEPYATHVDACGVMQDALKWLVDKSP
jgi:pimeloyl-ACP methyl ester carboxylesterase